MLYVKTAEPAMSHGVSFCNMTKTGKSSMYANTTLMSKSAHLSS